MKFISKEDLKREYFELKKKKNLSDTTIINYLMSKLKSDYLITELDGIYVYMGTYKLVHESSDAWYPVYEELVDENNPNAEYKIFNRLDSGLKKSVRIGKDMEIFEKSNTIIFIPNFRNFEAEFTFEEDFKKLRNLYFHELFAKDEETATSVVTSEQWIKDVFSFENYIKENNISPVFYKAFFDAALYNQKENSHKIVLSFHK